MKALVKKKAERGLWLEEVPEPEVGINDVLIKIHKTSICGTDVHIYNWDEWSRKNIPVPLTIGHEFVGEVAALGANVHDFEVGDIVSGEGHLVCGRCRNCLAGRRHLCANTSGVGISRNGAYAEYLSIPVTNAWHCDPSIPEEILLLTIGRGVQYTLVRPSNQIPDGTQILSEARLGQLREYLKTIHEEFAILYDVRPGEDFAIEIEYKITSEGKLAIKQACPWIY